MVEGKRLILMPLIYILDFGGV